MNQLARWIVVSLALGQAACIPSRSYAETPMPAPPEIVAREKAAIQAYRAASFLTFDRDGDGALDRDEWRAKEWAFHLIFDRDGDGQLDFTEFMALKCGEPRPPVQQVYFHCSRVRSQEFLRAAGSNRGMIDAGDIRRQADGWFRMNDKNHDRVVSEAEYRKR